jgi:ASCH domain
METVTRSVLVIETVSVVILPFNEVSEQFAFEEGEGNRSLAYWRMAHENYFRRNHFENRAFDQTMRLFANGSRLSAQSIDARVASRLRGMAARTECRAKRVPTLVVRFLGRFNQGRMQTRLSALTPFRLCGKVGSAEVAAH